MRGHDLENAINSALLKIRKRKSYKRPPPESGRLYKSHIVHPPSISSCNEGYGNDPSNLVSRGKRDEEDDNPAIHYGLIASADKLIKDASIRDKLAAEREVLYFEIEVAGLINHFPYLIIRGIYNHSDSHKNKEWQGFTAIVAVAYIKDLLRYITPN